MKLLTHTICIFLIISCRRSYNGVAEKICSCYDRIHSESVIDNDAEITQKKVNVCNEMLANKLSSLNNDEKTIFIKEFRKCQTK